MRLADNQNGVLIEDNFGAYTRSCVAPAVSRRMTASGMLRPVISIDAAFCKAPLAKGKFVAAACHDANNSPVILAFAHFATDESTANWTWFLQLLKESHAHWLSQCSGAVVCLTDGNAGLAAALSSVLPEAEHVLCAKHLEKYVLAKAGAVALNYQFQLFHCLPRP